MVLPASRPRSSFVAVAAVLFAGGSPSKFASALSLIARNCTDLAALPTGPMTEDVDLFLDSDVFACDEVRNGCESPGWCLACVRYCFTPTLWNTRFARSVYPYDGSVERNFMLSGLPSNTSRLTSGEANGID